MATKKAASKKAGTDTQKEDTSPRVHQRDKLKQRLNITPLKWTEKQQEFIDISLEQSSLEKSYSDMVLIDSVCSSNKDFLNLLRSPIIKTWH